MTLSDVFFLKMDKVSWWFGVRALKLNFENKHFKIQVYLF
jgi:hypothetical protein